MSWRDQLRPGSFRGVPFEADSHTGRGGRKGAHHTYPNRDRGWVEDLGLNDRRLSIEAYVIGDDYMARRDALDAAMQQPGSGTLIHPWLGTLTVVPEPQVGHSFSESAARGRMARFTLNFLRAADTAEFPGAVPDRSAALATQASQLNALAVDASADRMNLGGPAPVAAATIGETERVTARIAAAQPLVASAAPVDTAPVLARAVTAIGGGDIEAALTAIADLVLAVIGAVETDPAGVLAASRVLLDVARPTLSGTTVAETRIAANAVAIDDLVRLTVLGQSAQALAANPYPSAGTAFSALRAFDADVEALILRQPIADIALMRALGELRGTAREALLEGAANLVPIARVDPKGSLPGLALAWRVSGGIALEADLLSRNGVAHPLWCPPDSVEVRVEDGNV